VDGDHGSSPWTAACPGHVSGKAGTVQFKAAATLSFMPDRTNTENAHRLQFDL
jgi:hypothetical protein